MKILKRGKNPDDQPWRGRCTHCRSKIEAVRSELEEVEYDQREHGYFGRTPCPVCRQSMLFYPVDNAEVEEDEDEEPEEESEPCGVPVKPSPLRYRALSSYQCGEGITGEWRGSIYEAVQDAELWKKHGGTYGYSIQRSDGQYVPRNCSICGDWTDDKQRRVMFCTRCGGSGYLEDKR